MKKFLKFLFLVVLVTNSCTKNSSNRKELLKKEALNWVATERMGLNNTRHIIQETGDTIVIENLTLIENTFSNFDIDTTKKRIRIFSFNTPPLTSSFFQTNSDSLLSEIKNMESSILDTTFLSKEFPIDKPQEWINEKVRNKTDLWIARNENKKSFLQISEPIINSNNEILISSQISLRDYIIDKTVILSKKNNNWEIVNQNTLIGKYLPPEKKEIKNENGKTTFAITRALIFLGDYDI